MRILDKGSPAREGLRKLAYEGISLAHVGSRRYCCVCDRGARRFLPKRTRPEARCPHCQSLERHRATWLFIRDKSGLLEARGKRVLHVAAEPAFAPLLREAIGGQYVTADLMNPKADVKLDVCDNPFRNEWFDFVICNHVLEHVADDRKAMREIRRVLKPGGRALILVPLMAETSHEDPSITDPEERTRRYGQADHVRAYGLDIVERLESALLEVEVFHPCDLCPPELADKMSLGDTVLFWCKRPD